MKAKLDLQVQTALCHHDEACRIPLVVNPQRDCEVSKWCVAISTQATGDCPLSLFRESPLFLFFSFFFFSAGLDNCSRGRGGEDWWRVSAFKIFPKECSTTVDRMKSATPFDGVVAAIMPSKLPTLERRLSSKERCCMGLQTVEISSRELIDTPTETRKKRT